MQKTIAVMLLLFATGASAQGISGKVGSAVGGAAAVGGSTVNGLARQSNGFGALNAPVTGPTSGELPGSFGMKVGDKVIQFRGAVGVGDDRSNFKAGAGIPF